MNDIVTRALWYGWSRTGRDLWKRIAGAEGQTEPQALRLLLELTRGQHADVLTAPAGTDPNRRRRRCF